MADQYNMKLVLEYDGSQYHGWQRQKNAMTIQEQIEDNLQKMMGEPIRVIASGRTDAGVHALNQVCNFLTHSDIAPDGIRRGINSLLPEDIFIKEVACVPLDFHSRYSARAKTYEYRILNRKNPDIFLRQYTWHIHQDLDVVSMKQCLKHLQGRHDFSSFRSSGSGNVNPIREMIMSEILGPDEDIYCMSFKADGFLRHMVRSIVGTVVDVGRGRIGVHDFLDILHSEDRQRAGIKAPPQGLFLMGVEY